MTNVLLKKMKVIQMKVDISEKQQGGWVVQITGKDPERGTWEVCLRNARKY